MLPLVLQFSTINLELFEAYSIQNRNRKKILCEPSLILCEQSLIICRASNGSP